jgi:hypothetical protein
MPDLTSEDVGKVPNASASFGTVPQDSESFRKVPHGAEAFGTLRHGSERKENHTMTVREASRMFEEDGVARTERSIVSWCQPNRMGMARLDCYFDPNERRYFITPESVHLAIEEEKARANKGQAPSSGSASQENSPNSAESRQRSNDRKAPNDSEEVSELRKEIMDLKIANRGKDMFIEQLAKERTDFVSRLIESSRKVGELETRLFMLEAPDEAEQKDANAKGGAVSGGE